MSALKEDRWQASMFFRHIGPYRMVVERSAGGWVWQVSRGSKLNASGRQPDEKAAKLYARRAVERLLVKGMLR